ncbi:hypothetical protein MKY08_05390 [Lysinibacillus sp. FSL M8-0337]|uniref:hypothetical protein n=1 Tax=Lysinibacillus TaxID=400634 RepID=UPI00084A84C9|nr:hypothetical protein [Lysinibacillus sphaericus]
MYESMLNQIDAVTGSGKVIISANESTVVEIVKETIESGRSASFYLTNDQAKAVKMWYWTPERIKASKIQPISNDEKARIKAELGIEVHSFRFSPIQCECGHIYGGFEFLQQGVRDHGVNSIKAVFNLKNSMFLQANPTLVPVCPNCNQMLISRDGGPDGGPILGDLEYDCDQYVGCCIVEREPRV